LSCQKSEKKSGKMARAQAVAVPAATWWTQLATDVTAGLQRDTGADAALPPTTIG
jgi:hypothetical protein